MWVLVAFFSAGIAGGALCAQEMVPYMEAGVGRKQGDFGTSIQSTLLMGYATFGASVGRWDANLTMPYLRVDRAGSGQRSKEQGLGDIVARSVYRFLSETEEGWTLDGIGALKLPTASDTKSLGTGRSDGGLFLVLGQRMGLFRWTVQAGRIQGASGEPTGTTESLTSGANVVGVSGSWTFDGTRWGLAFESRGPAYQGLPGAREITVDVFQPLSTRWGFKAMATVGLSDGGPRQSFGVAVIRVFL